MFGFYGVLKPVAGESKNVIDESGLRGKEDEELEQL